MLTDDQILQGCKDLGNKDATEEDVAAFRRFMKAFQCEDAETYEEAHEKIDISLCVISKEIEGLSGQQQKEIYVERMKGLWLY